jgi:hypothetical protein
MQAVINHLFTVKALCDALPEKFIEAVSQSTALPGSAGPHPGLPMPFDFQELADALLKPSLLAIEVPKDSATDVLKDSAVDVLKDSLAAVSANITELQDLFTAGPGLQSVIARASRYVETGKYKVRFTPQGATLILVYGPADHEVSAERLEAQVRGGTLRAFVFASQGLLLAQSGSMVHSVHALSFACPSFSFRPSVIEILGLCRDKLTKRGHEVRLCFVYVRFCCSAVPFFPCSALACLLLLCVVFQLGQKGRPGKVRSLF